MALLTAHLLTAHLLLILLLAGSTHLTPDTSQEVRGHTSLRERPEPFKVLVSEGCLTSGSQQEGGGVVLQAGAPLVLTHRISLLPPSGGGCGCQEELGLLLGRLEGLEREVSALRVSCTEGQEGCCSSKESKGSGCVVRPGANLCPGNCSSRGRCVGGVCSCDPPYTGADCSSQASSSGASSSGASSSEASSSGASSSEASCPGGCSSRGRCVGGVCVCSRVFSGPDCSRCAAGLSGPSCEQGGPAQPAPHGNIALSAVSDLMAVDITESSVTLLWAPPPVQYQTYHITFTSKKDNQQIRAQVDGSLARFIQTGLAPGQEYSATVTGETHGKSEASTSVQFNTLTSRPTNLRVVKTSTSSAVVQWEPAQGEIDRYHLTVSPNDGVGEAQEIALPPERDSAHIEHLEAGRFYDITLRAESGAGQSLDAAVQVTPGPTVPSSPLVTITVPVPPATAQGIGDRPMNPASSTVGSTRSKQMARTKPLGNFQNGLKTKPGEQVVLTRRLGGPRFLRLNSTRTGPGWRRAESGPLKKTPVGAMKKKPTMILKPRHGPPVGDDAMPESHSSRSSSGGDHRDEWPARLVPVVNPSGADVRASSEETTIIPGSNMDPEVAMVTQGNQMGHGELPELSAHGGTPINEKKCLNKVKVTHIRLPHQEPGGDTVVLGCDTSQGDGTPGGGASPAPDDRSSDHLHQLLKDTFDNRNVKTFSVHLSKPSDFSLNADSVRDQILAGLMSVSSPVSSSSSSVRTFYSSLLASPNSLPRSSSSSPSPLISQSSSSAPISSKPTTTKPSTAPPFHSSSDKKSLDYGSETLLDIVRNRESNPDKASVTEERQPPMLPPQSSQNASFQRRRKLVSFGNTTRFNSRPALALNRKPGKEFSLVPTSSSLEDPSTPRRTLNRNTKGTAIVKLFAKQNQTTSWREGGEPSVLRTPGGYVDTNRRHPRLRRLKPPRHMNPETQASDMLPPSMAMSFPSGDPDPGNGSEPGTSGDGGRSNTDGSAMAELNQNPGEMAVPALHSRPYSAGDTRRSAIRLSIFQNRTRPNFKPRNLPRRPAFPRRPNGDKDVITDQIQINQSRVWESLPKISSQSEKQDDVHSFTHKITPVQPSAQFPKEENLRSGLATKNNSLKVHHNQTKSEQTLQSGSQDYPRRFVTSQSGFRTDRLHQEEAGSPISGSDILIESVDSGGSEHRAGTPPPRVLLNGSETLGRKVLTPSTAAQRRTGHSPTQRRNQNTVSQQSRKGQQSQSSKAAHPGMNGARHEFHVSPAGSPGELPGEPLDYVGVRNQTSDGFTLVWDAPEGKYSSFVVTRREEHGSTAEEERLEEEEEEEEEAPPEEAMKHRGVGEENAIPESNVMHAPATRGAGLTGSDTLFTRELPGSDRSFVFEKLAPRTPFTVTLRGTGTGLLSRLHKLVISTGPSPPSDLEFSQVSEDSVTLTWTRPPDPVSSFRVTYTHTLEGEPVSVVVGSQDSSLSLSQLSPGSSYEVSVISVLGLDESDPIQDLVMTLPDSPSDLRVLNVSDSKALLLWRPAMAAVDKYAIVYETGQGSGLKITVSGNTAEQQLAGLEESTTYSVTITSLLGDTHSPPATASFTTTAGSAGEEDEGPQDLQARQVTPRTTLLSWEPPATTAVDSYRLTYQTEGEEPKEVTLDATTTNHKLRHLRPGSSYTATLLAERDGRTSTALSTYFTTGSLSSPSPADCSEELLNGMRESGEAHVFLGGAGGVPLPVYCDMETDGGGWTVFQRRVDGSVDFFRGWRDYIQGFGELGGEFWLGLDNLHNLTRRTHMSLRVDLRAGDEAVYAQYSTFQVAKKNYRLSVAGYSGTAGDSLSYHNQRPFSTRDRDPAASITRCAVSYRGGWWYKNCHQANLNGLYGAAHRHQGVIWTTWKGKDFSVPFTEMKMRPSAFTPH